jgi:hypothetical protein
MNDGCLESLPICLALFALDRRWPDKRPLWHPQGFRARDVLICYASVTVK